MSTRVLTLFDDVEVQPEQIEAVGKSRAVKKTRTKKEPAEKPAKKKVEDENKEPDMLDTWEGDKQYYSIGEVAALFGVKTSHIRFWTNEFALKVRTTRKGDRLYTPDQVREIRTIYHLVKERGFTISGAKTKLKTNKKTEAEVVDLKQSLLQLRNRLLLIRNQL
jgi:DNA-binding transcriptional MerR regulator